MIEAFEEYAIKKIGNTPILQSRIYSNLFFKLEIENPTGSHKDRLYLYLIKKLEAGKKISPGMTLIDYSSGNSGAALAFMGKILGYKVIIVRPSDFSIGKKKQIEAYGGKIIETPVEKGIKAAREKSFDLLEELGSDAYMLYQTDNPLNMEAMKSIGHEIVDWQAANNIKFDFFVSPVGTGGTLSAVSSILKKNQNIKTVAIDIEEAPQLYNQMNKECRSLNPHIIEGTSVGEVYPNTYLDTIDRVVLCSSKDAIETSKKLAINECVWGGYSSGASYKIATEIANNNQNKNVLTLIWDYGWKYI